MFSHRTAFDRALNRLTVSIAEIRARGGGFVDLTSANPTTSQLPYDEARIRAALSDPRSLRYTPEPFGLVSARETLVARLPSPPPVDRLLLTASTSEAYGLVLKLLCDPGDEVLVPQPSYPLFDHLAALEGVRLVPYRLAYDGAWHVDVDSLRQAKNDRSRAVIVVSPNNPTGSFLKRDEHEALAALGLPIVSDEVFADYGFGEDPRRVLTARERSDVLTFAMGGLSKSCGLPQMKLAWTSITGPVAAAKEAAERLELVADVYLSPSAPVQVGLPELLVAGDATRAALLARAIRNRAAIRDAITAHHAPITLLHLEGGWTACLRLPSTHGEEEWVLALLEHAGVMVQPGAFYDFHDEPMIVVSLVTPEDRLAAGLARILGFVTRW